MSTPTLIKPIEVAQMLSVSLPTVKRMLADSVLPSLKIGRCRRVPVEAVKDLIQRRCEAARSAATSGL